MHQQEAMPIKFVAEPAPPEPEQVAAPPLRPEAWIGAAADYQGEQRYGDWVAMARPDDEVRADVKRLLARTPSELGSFWGLFATRGFGYWHPPALERLDSVTRAARNIVSFGLPYRALVAALGPESLAISPDRYRVSYIGEFASRRAFAERVAADSGWQTYLDNLPRTMQGFVHIDYDGLSAEAERELTIVDKHDGGVWVYDPRVW